jgi:hypothetical protein
VIHRVISGNDAGNYEVVPNNISLRCSRRGCTIVSSSIIEFKSVCEGLSAKSTSGGLRVTDEVVLSIKGEILSNLEVNVTIELANL